MGRPKTSRTATAPVADPLVASVAEAEQLDSDDGEAVDDDAIDDEVEQAAADETLAEPEADEPVTDEPEAAPEGHHITLNTAILLACNALGMRAALKPSDADPQLMVEDCDEALAYNRLMDHRGAHDHEAG